MGTDTGFVECYNCSQKLPKKEPKQETLEEAAWELAKQKFEEKCGYEPNLYNSQDLLVVSSIQEGILIGAKWQQERSYSEQEAFNMLMEFWKEERPGFKTNPVCVSNWFEQFKKK